MIKLGMRSIADSVKGQGVGSAYLELVRLLQKYGRKDFKVNVNRELDTCDVVHYHNIDPVSLVQMMTVRKPSVTSVHFIPETLKGSLCLPSPISSLLDLYTIWFYRHADYVHVVNPSVVKRLVQYGIPENRIRVIPNVVSTDGFYRRDAEERKEIRSRYGIPEDAFVVLGCGQIQTRKGVKTFAKVAAHMPKLRFVWVGGFSFGAVTDGYADLKKLMENPPPNLLFTGIIEREEVSALMGAADVFFLPSFHEQCCMAVLEAANCELPILLRDLGDYHRLYNDLCLYAGSGTGFVEKLRYLHTHPDFCRQQSKKATQLSHLYSEEHIYSLWKKFYYECAR
ncbi:MAG: glycosyltransferase family 4 protein [Oscillospiraceae bacterium]|nr:glycosyltransferase family 4 protein [Oscillospiraceae bacterium]